MSMNTLPFSLGSHTPTKFTTSTKLSSLITNHPNTTSEQASSTVKFSTNQHNDNPIVLIKRREAIGGIGLCCGFLLDVLSQSQLASAADGASLCELTVAPSGLAYCDKMVGTGPEAVKGQLIKAHYVGKLDTGTVFDSSYNRGKPLTFRVGVGEAVMASYERANMGRSSSRGINVAFVWSRSNILQQQLTPPTHHLHAIFCFLPSLLLSFLQLKYKPLLVSPFETHPMTMLVSITSLIGYCLAYAYGAKLRFSSADHAMPDYGPIISRVMGLSGSLCLVSLASILYPDSVRVVLYLLYPLFLASQFEFVRRQLQMLWNWLHQRVTSRFQQEMRMRWASINRRLWFITPANAHREGLLPLYQ